MDQDKISDLPGHVLDQILSCLSFKEAVRTSVLSTNWRYKCASVTSLVIDDNNQRTGPTDSVVDEILFLRMGPIHKFKLFCCKRVSPEKVQKWILYLSRQPIHELVLHIKFADNDLYRTPSYLFHCQELTHLDLDGLTLSLPSAFDGFKNLKSLTLSFFFDQQNVEELISRCPLLERVTLSDYCISQLNIYGPNLLYFCFRGHFVDIRFRSAPRLADVYIDVDGINEAFEEGITNAIGDMGLIMAGIPQIRRLMFGGLLLDYLSAGNKPRALPIACTNLSYLSIDILFSRLNEVALLLCLLRSAPNLEELQIGFRPRYQYMIEEDLEPLTSRDAKAWDTNSLDSMFTRLRLVKIRNFSGTKDEMDIFKFVLLASPALECMTIELEEKLFNERDGTRKFEIMNTLLSFKRASPEAEITVCGSS